MVEEGDHGPGHEIPSRLVAGHREQQEEQVELELGELVALDLGLGENTEEVLVRVEPLLLAQLVGIGIELESCLAGGIGGDLVLGILGADHPVGPVEDEVTVLLGDAHEIGDDLQRQFGRDLLDEVGRAGFTHPVDDGVGRGHHHLLEIPHHAGGEALADQSSVAGVHRRVHVQHHHPLLGQDLFVEVVEQGCRPIGREVLEVTIDLYRVIEAGDRPEPSPKAVGIGMPVNRGFPAELSEPFVGYAGDEVVGVAEVDVAQFHSNSLRRPPLPWIARHTARQWRWLAFLERVSVIIR